MADARLEGLLTDIACDPEDRSLYPILADFLEDQGESSRAHLIRIQLEQETLPSDDPRLLVLEDEDHELLAEHASGWVDGPPPPGVELELDWWLGRLYVGGRSDRWKQAGRDWLLRQALWLAGFSLFGGADEVLPDLIPTGCLRLINKLELHDPGVTDESLAYLIHLPHLRELNLWLVNPAEAVVAQLGRLSQLRDLKFWSLWIERKGRDGRFVCPPVPEEVLEELRQRLPQCRIQQHRGVEAR